VLQAGQTIDDIYHCSFSGLGLNVEVNVQSDRATSVDSICPDDIFPGRYGKYSETKGSGTNPRYVLMVEKFLAETDSTVTIPWQGKAVTLPKSEISIEKHEKRYRITAPARLLK
jgi:hypothetical protein